MLRPYLTIGGVDPFGVLRHCVCQTIYPSAHVQDRCRCIQETSASQYLISPVSVPIVARRFNRGMLFQSRNSNISSFFHTAPLGGIAGQEYSTAPSFVRQCSCQSLPQISLSIQVNTQSETLSSPRGQPSRTRYPILDSDIAWTL